MIDREILKKVRRLQIYTRKSVTNVFAGEYASVFKGRGMEFDEVREYIPGDDVRTIDWNVTARTGRPYVKRYVEERELTVMLLVDVTASLLFGTRNRSKSEFIAELCAIISFLAASNNDKLGLILFGDEVKAFIPPKKGIRHMMRTLREILTTLPSQGPTNIAGALEHLNRVMRKKAVVFLVSDFLADGFEKQVSLTSRRHDLIAIQVIDPAEEDLPPCGTILFEDVESGSSRLVDTSSESVRAAFRECNAAKRRTLEENMKAAGVDFLRMRTDGSALAPLEELFRKRARRMAL